MEITLSLSNTQGALLKALSPRGAAKTTNSLEKTALRILAEGMTREAKMRRINAGQVLGIALVEAVERKKQRIT